MESYFSALKAQAYSQDEYEKAEKLCKSNAIYQKQYRFIYPQRVSVAVNVYAKRMSYYVQLQYNLNEKNIEKYTCQCEVASLNEGCCCHVLAVVMRYLDSKECKESLSDHDGLRLMHNYQMLERDEVKGMVEQASAPVHVHCLLQIGEESNTLRVKIGRERMYLVKNFAAFRDCVNQKRTVKYGKAFEWNHDTQSVVPEEQPLLHKILQLANAQTHDYFYPYKGNNSTAVTLTNPDYIDELLTYWVAHPHTVSIAFLEGKEQALPVLAQNPTIPMQAIAQQDESLRLEMPKLYTVNGRNHIGFYTPNGLYVCDQIASKALHTLVNTMCNQPFRTVLPPQSIRGFFATVYPVLSPYLSVDGDLSAYACYQAQNFDVQLSVDMPKEDAITCKVTLHYPEKSINPLEANENLPETLIRNTREEMALSMKLDSYFPTHGKRNYLLTGDDETIYHFLRNTLPQLAELGQIYVSDRLRSRSTVGAPKVQAHVSLTGSLLSLQMEISDFTTDELTQALEAYQKKQRFYRLKNGAFMDLNEETLGAISELTDTLEIETKDLLAGINMPSYRAMEVNSLLHKRNDVSFDRGSAFKTLVRTINNATDNDYALPTTFKGTLRGYQKEGFSWLTTLTNAGLHGILADDMGLGKTIQILAFLLAHKEKNATVRALVVCPASLVLNWQEEAKRFAPSLRLLALMGLAEEREQYIASPAWEVLVTSYDQLKRDIDHYSQLTFDYQIIDEAQTIKNAQTKAAKSVKSITAHHRFALTGTPIENRLSELWSIFDFLMPGYLHTYNKFKKKYEVPIMRQQDERLAKRMQRITAPFVLRRLKSDVLSELPPKEEIVRYAHLVGEQKKLYLAHALQVREEFQTVMKEKKGTQIKILELMLRLRQLCCDPSLYVEDYHGESAKLESCLELVREAVEGGHKILIFSQFTSMLDIIETHLQKMDIPSLTIRGATSKKDRQERVHSFQRGHIPVFLISLKAGGLGLNLTAADTVILYDPWWNTAAENQAADRAYRMGQTKSVQVYRLIAKDTLEERILELQKRKKDLAESVVTGGNTLTTLTTADWEALFEV